MHHVDVAKFSIACYILSVLITIFTQRNSDTDHVKIYQIPYFAQVRDISQI